MTLYFLVYNDNTHLQYLTNLLDSVKKYNKEFEIIIFNKKDIDVDFVNKNSLILNLPRGGGYWLWKPYIINNLLLKINYDDIIFYLDSKYYFTEDFTNLYNDYMITNDLLVWNNKPNEESYLMKNYCKMDVIIKYGLYNEVFKENAIDCWAGGLVVKKTNNTLNLIKEWLDIACVYENITDSNSYIKNYIDFIEHRHDQSCLNVVLKRNNVNPAIFFPKKFLQNIRMPYTL